MNTSPDANIHELISVLNDLFSANYACLNFANQDGSFDSARVIGNEIFKQNPITKSWQQAKMSDSSKARNEMFKYFKEKQIKVNQNSNFDDELTAVKQPLIETYNYVFGTNKKFEEVFDGFKIKDKKFAEVARQFNIHSIFVTDKEEISYLMYCYHNYVQTYKYYTALKAFDEVFEALDDDITERGYPSIYFNKTSNPKILRLSKTQIDELASSASALASQVEQDIKSENLTIAPLYKKARKLARKKQSTHEIYAQINRSKSKILTMLDEQKITNTLKSYTDILKQRFISANTPYGFDRFFSATLSVFDTLMQTGSAKKSNLKVDKVYVHKNELEYLEFLFEMLKHRGSQTKQASTESQQKQ